MAHKEQWRVQSFGRDCMGNITGYVVVRGFGWDREEAGIFTGNIYEFGTFDAAYKKASALCDELNSLVEA